MTDLEKRTWCYVQSPDNFDFPAHDCGTIATQWSEYKGHLWCEECQKDFIPSHNGVFDGPIPVATAMMLGMSFHTVDLATGKITPFQFEDQS